MHAHVERSAVQQGVAEQRPARQGEHEAVAGWSAQAGHSCGASPAPASCPGRCAVGWGAAGARGRARTTAGHDAAAGRPCREAGGWVGVGARVRARAAPVGHAAGNSEHRVKTAEECAVQQHLAHARRQRQRGQVPPQHLRRRAPCCMAFYTCTRAAAQASDTSHACYHSVSDASADTDPQGSRPVYLARQTTYCSGLIVPPEK